MCTFKVCMEIHLIIYESTCSHSCPVCRYAEQEELHPHPTVAITSPPPAPLASSPPVDDPEILSMSETLRSPQSSLRDVKTDDSVDCCD